MAVYSQPDCRDYAIYPNDTVDIQDTLFYTVPANPSHADPTDSRAAGPPQDCRVVSIIPLNCRNPLAYPA